jgi:hypothetical protein
MFPKLKDKLDTKGIGAQLLTRKNGLLGRTH